MIKWCQILAVSSLFMLAIGALQQPNLSWWLLLAGFINVGTLFLLSRIELVASITRSLKQPKRFISERIYTPPPVSPSISSSNMGSQPNIGTQQCGDDQLIEAFPFSVLIVARDGTIVATNGKVNALLGYEKDQLIGANLRRLFTAYKDKRIDALFDALRVQAGSLHEMLASTSQSVEIAVDVSCSEQLENSRLIVCLMDARQRRELEQAKRELISVVSHDLRSPLTSVTANLELLASGVGGVLNEEGMRIANSANRELKRLIRLVNEILEIEKMDAGRLQLNLNILPLSVIVETAEEAVAGLAARQDVSLNSEIAEIDVAADGEKMVQVLVNLLSNAIKFSPEGSVVKTSARISEGWVDLKVQDSGPGISDRDRDKVFERFRQSTRADKRHSSGSGLGLSICKAIVQAHGGTIGLDSEPGNGTVFWIKLPLPGMESANA